MQGLLDSDWYDRRYVTNVKIYITTSEVYPIGRIILRTIRYKMCIKSAFLEKITPRLAFFCWYTSYIFLPAGLAKNVCGAEKIYYFDNYNAIFYCAYNNTSIYIYTFNHTFGNIWTEFNNKYLFKQSNKTIIIK